MRRLIGISLKFLWRKKIRNGLVLFGIVLSVAFTVGIATVLDSIYLDFVSQARNDSFVDFTIKHKTQKFFSSSLMEVLTPDKRISKVSPVIFTLTSLSIGSQDSITLGVYGLDPKTHPDFPSIQILAGEKSLEPGQIMLSYQLAQVLGLSVGQIIPVSFKDIFGAGTSEAFVKVSAIFEHPNFGQVSNIPLVLINLEYLQTQINRKGQISEIVITIKDLLQLTPLEEDLSAVIGVDYYVRVESQLTEGLILTLISYRVALNIIILLTALVEFVFLLNMIIVNVSDQSREFGILKTIGFSNRDIFAFLVFQLLLQGTLGALIGLVLGRFLASSLVEYFGSLVDFWRPPPLAPFSVSYFYLAVIIGVGVTLIAGIYPILTAIRLPTIQMSYERSILAFSQYSEKKTLKFWGKPTLLLAFSLGMLGFLMSTQIQASQLLKPELLSFHFLSVFLVFIGLFMLQFYFIMNLLPLVAKKTLDTFTTISLATRDMYRNTGRTLLTITASTLTLSFLLLVSILITSLAAGVPDWYQSSFGIDVVAVTEEDLQAPISVLDEVKNLSWVENAFYLQELRGITGEKTLINIFGINSTQFEQYSPPMVVGTKKAFSRLSTVFIVPESELNQKDNKKLNLFTLKSDIDTYNSIQIDIYEENFTVSVPPNNIFVVPTILSSIYADDNDIIQQDVIKATINSTFSLYLYVEAIVQTNIFLPSTKYSYVETNVLRTLLQLNTFRYLYIKMKPLYKLTQAEIEKDLKQIFDFSRVNIINQISERIQQGIRRQQIFFETLLSEAIIIAALSQFFSLIIAALHLSYDVALLRTMGLDKRGVFLIFFTQSIFVAFFGFVFALFDAFLAAKLLLFYLSFIGADIPLVIPVDQIFIWTLIYFVILSISAIFPAIGTAEREINEVLTGRNISIQAILVTAYRKFKTKQQIPLSKRHHIKRLGLPVPANMQKNMVLPFWISAFYSDHFLISSTKTVAYRYKKELFGFFTFLLLFSSFLYYFRIINKLPIPSSLLFTFDVIPSALISVEISIILITIFVTLQINAYKLSEDRMQRRIHRKLGKQMSVLENAIERRFKVGFKAKILILVFLFATILLSLGLTLVLWGFAQYLMSTFVLSLTEFSMVKDFEPIIISVTFLGLILVLLYFVVKYSLMSVVLFSVTAHGSATTHLNLKKKLVNAWKSINLLYTTIYKKLLLLLVIEFAILSMLDNIINIFGISEISLSYLHYIIHYGVFVPTFYFYAVTIYMWVQNIVNWIYLPQTMRVEDVFRIQKNLHFRSAK